VRRTALFEFYFEAVQYFLQKKGGRFIVKAASENMRIYFSA